jgi:hypothetical protein
MRRILKDRPLTGAEKQRRHRQKLKAALPPEERERCKRHRPTKDEYEKRQVSLLEIVEQMQPMTVRQIFYQATVKGIVEKTESGYTKVQTDLVKMRRSGLLPYGWIADNTRWQRKPATYGSVEEALKDTAQFYRKSLWSTADAYVEVWLEKDALAGVIYPVTQEYDVPLMVARGYASLSFLHSAAEAINDVAKPVYIYHLGDFDPSGVNAAHKIDETLRELAPFADITFERLAVTPDQIDIFGLPSRPTKKSDPRSKAFHGESVELDAFEPDDLRSLVREAIEKHLPRYELDILLEAEASERAILQKFVKKLPPAMRGTG